MTSASPMVDVLILGGGPGGLAVASGLVRQVYSAAIFDSGVYRNAPTQHMHNVPGWDHQPPAAFRKKAREDLLRRYEGIQFVDKQVSQVTKVDNGFEAIDADGTIWTGRRLVLATGWKDKVPAIPGYADCWGKGIFHCLFCHGYEERGKPSVGVLAVDLSASSPVALHLARMALRLAGKATVYTNGNEELGNQILADLQATGTEGAKARITVDNRKMSRFALKNPDASDVTISFNEGAEVTEGFVVHGPAGEINGPFAEQLGLELNPAGEIKTEAPFCETTVKGVFAVGDCATPMKAVSQAISMGSLVAAGIAMQLGVELA